MALPHDPLEQIDAVVESTEPARLNWNQALLEVLDAYVRCRLMSTETDPSPVYVTQRVYHLARKGGLLTVMKQRFPNVEFRAKPSTIRGAHPSHVIFDEAAGFEQ